ncbi:MAG: TonB family protein [Sinobacteraceae bacterium]|nr:TonB family protein [Nevskiaceae bacterium]
MRVLVVDQDSTSNLAITRSLRDRYTVDAVGSKAACLDLLRSNTFEAIVACERLDDGSGLELLGQVAKRWPRMLRLFAADRERLKLLRGRLGPFELFQTLPYPIEPERLGSALGRAESGGKAEAEPADDVPEEQAQNPFPPPQPAPRVAPAAAASPPPRPARPRPRVGGRRVHSLPVPASQPASTDADSDANMPRGRPRQGSVKFPQIDRLENTAASQVFLGSGSLRRKSSQPAGVVALGRAASSLPVRAAASPLSLHADSNLESPRLPWLIGGVVAACGAILIGLAMFRPHAAPPVQVSTGPTSAPTAPAVSEPAPLPAPSAPAAPVELRKGARAAAHSAVHANAKSPATPAAAPAAGSNAAPATSSQTLAGSPQQALPPETPAGFTMIHAQTSAASSALPAASSPDGSAAATPAGGATAPKAVAAAQPSSPPDSQSTQATPKPSRAAPGEPPPVVREAKLIRRVRPDYPSAARRESIVGSVDLDVTVSSRGDVTNIAVLRADPPGMFEKSAVSAVRKWKYDPQYVDGLPADAHLNVHLDFNPG